MAIFSAVSHARDDALTGGELPHETGGAIRVASRLVDLSRNRPTASSSLWGVHTPSSAAVDGLFANGYLEPFSTMDEYGRVLAQDHIPNIFMTAVSVSWFFSHAATVIFQSLQFYFSCMHSARMLRSTGKNNIDCAIATAHGCIIQFAARVLNARRMF